MARSKSQSRKGRDQSRPAKRDDKAKRPDKGAKRAAPSPAPAAKKARQERSPSRSRAKPEKRKADKGAERVHVTPAAKKAARTKRREETKASLKTLIEAIAAQFRSGNQATKRNLAEQLVSECAKSQTQLSHVEEAGLLPDMVPVLVPLLRDGKRWAVEGLALFAEHPRSDVAKRSYEAGALPALVALLRTADLQEAACSLVAQVADHYPTPVADANAILPLSKVLATGTDRGKASAARALARIAQIDQPRTDQVLAAQVMTPLMHLLFAVEADKVSDHLVTAAVKFLGTLASKRGKSLEVHEGVVTRVLDILDESSCAATRRACVLALGKLSEHPERAKVCVEEGLDSLVKLLPEAAYQLEAAQVLADVTAHDALLDAFDDEACAAVVQVLQEGGAPARQKAAQVVANLARAPSLHSKLWAAGAVPLLLGQPSATSLHALRRLSKQHAARFLAVPGAVPHVLAQLRDGPQDAAAKCLIELTSSDSAVCDLVLRGGVPALLQWEKDSKQREEMKEQLKKDEKKDDKKDLFGKGKKSLFGGGSVLEKKKDTPDWKARIAQVFKNDVAFEGLLVAVRFAEECAPDAGLRARLRVASALCLLWPDGLDVPKLLARVGGLTGLLRVLRESSGHDVREAAEAIAAALAKTEMPDLPTIDPIPLQGTFPDMFNNKELSDVTLKSSDGKTFFAHKFFLHNKSRYLEKLITKANTKANTTGKNKPVLLPHHTAGQLEPVLRFLYTGDVSCVTPTNARELITVAHQMGINELVRCCERVLAAAEALDRLSDTLALAKQCKAKALEHWCGVFALRSLPDDSAQRALLGVDLGPVLGTSHPLA